MGLRIKQGSGHATWQNDGMWEQCQDHCPLVVPRMLGCCHCPIPRRHIQPAAADSRHRPGCGVCLWWFGTFFLQKMLLTKTRFDSQISPISLKAYKSSTPVFAHCCCWALPREGRCLSHSSTAIYNGVFGWRWSTYLSNGNRAVNLILLISSHQLNGKQ